MFLFCFFSILGVLHNARHYAGEQAGADCVCAECNRGNSAVCGQLHRTQSQQYPATGNYHLGFSKVNLIKPLQQVKLVSLFQLAFACATDLVFSQKEVTPDCLKKIEEVGNGTGCWNGNQCQAHDE